MKNRVMIVVNVPTGEADAMREAIGKAGGGRLGEYSSCSFSIKGIGRFLPSSIANPSIGESGTLEAVEEERIEISCYELDASAIVSVIRDASSYEEPAVFVYQLLNIGQNF
ncbi:MAG: hypothetical protein ABI220_02850 [Candidatus Saccharimonadales bacterium]